MHVHVSCGTWIVYSMIYSTRLDAWMFILDLLLDVSNRASNGVLGRKITERSYLGDKLALKKKERKKDVFLKDLDDKRS